VIFDAPDSTYAVDQMFLIGLAFQVWTLWNTIVVLINDNPLNTDISIVVSWHRNIVGWRELIWSMVIALLITLEALKFPHLFQSLPVSLISHCDLLVPKLFVTSIRAPNPQDDPSPLEDLDVRDPSRHVYSRYTQEVSTRVEHILSRINVKKFCTNTTLNFELTTLSLQRMALPWHMLQD